MQNGDPARSGKHEHLFFLADDADGRIDRVAVIAPHLADRTATRGYGRELRVLERAIAELTVLRTGPAGALHLVAEPDDHDPLFGRGRVWISRTPYRPTRHPRVPADAADLATRPPST